MLSWETTSRSLGRQNAASLCTRGRLRGLGLSPCEHTGLMGWALDVRGCGCHAPWKRSENWASALCFPLSFSLLNLKGTLPFFWTNKRRQDRAQNSTPSSFLVVSASWHPVLSSLPWPQKGTYLPAGADHRDTWHNSRSAHPLLPELGREEFWPPKIKIIQVFQQILNNRSCFLPD